MCFADDIYLKNGRKIVAGVTREDPQRVFFERGGAEFAIPRSMIDRIEKSVPPAEPKPSEKPSAAKGVQDLPLPPGLVPDREPGTDSGPNLGKETRVTLGGAVDETYLSQLDEDVLRHPSPQTRRTLIQAYQEAAIFLTRRGDPEAAIEKYRHALKLAPDDLALSLALSYLSIKQGHHQQAVDVLLPLEAQNPANPDIPLLLGSAYYATERLDQAIDEWKKSLAIADNPQLRQTLVKVERERSASASYLELRSEHFLLRCEDQKVKALGEQILKSLESGFQELEVDLDVYPRETIVVLLYPDQVFQNITLSPSWVGALNDGKIRIPVSGLGEVTPELARVLKHELTHSFVRQVTLGRCPVWFNEGLAQYEEGRRLVDVAPRLATGFRQVPSYAELEGSFMGLSSYAAGVAYAKSLAGVDYLHETFGQGEIRRLLKAMSQEPNFSSVLRSELRLSLSDFENSVALYLEKR